MGGEDVPLTLSEFVILRELATTPYRTFTREQLAAAGRENFLMVVPEKVQADPSISTE